MGRRRGVKEHGPTIGVEVELAAFAPGRPVGNACPLPARMLQAALRQHATLPHPERQALWTCAGLFYQEMHRYLEAATWPAGDLPSLLRVEDAALVEARGMLQALGPELGSGTVMACYADDLAGSAAVLAGEGRATGEPASCSMGTHVNLRMDRDVFGDGGRRARQSDAPGSPMWTETCGAASFVLLASLLPEIVGPGGFVRSPTSRRLELWRDPRAAHTSTDMAAAAHYTHRPVLKVTFDRRRVQIVSLGWTAGRVDRLVKYGLLLLMASAVQGKRAPRLRLVDLRQVLHAPPGQAIRVATEAGERWTTRLDLLDELLDTVLEPETQRPEGAALGCSQAVALARRLVALLRAGEPAEEIARRVPTCWALKEQAFARICRDEGFELPLPGRPAPGADEGLLGKLAVIAIRESDLASDGVQRWLLSEVPGEPWSHEAVYAPDPEAVAAVRERRTPLGALDVAHDIAKALEPPGRSTGACATWDGPFAPQRLPELGILRRLADRLLPPHPGCPPPPDEELEDPPF